MEKSLTHFYEDRPWGNYEVLHKESGFQVKRLEIKPKARFSLQQHMKRAEKWIVVQGEGLATVGKNQTPVKKGSLVEIPKGEIHRMENRGDESLVMVEVQFGDYLEEDDIVRLEDDYDRI